MKKSPIMLSVGQYLIMMCPRLTQSDTKKYLMFICRGHIVIRYFPTDNMIGDFFTNPLQGSKFRRFRNIIMNCSYDEYGPVNMEKIRYFFVSDCVKRGHIIIRYCPTDDMIGDFFTNPLQGSNFRRFRNIIMNCSYDEYGPTASNKQEKMDDDSNTHSKNRDKKSVESQECVGSINEKDSIARKRTYAETVANYVTPRVAPKIAIATHV